MIRRTASEVLSSLEARVARLEGRTASTSNRTASPALSLYELAEKMGEQYIKKFRGKIAYWQELALPLENLVQKELEDKLDIEDYSDIENNIKATIKGFSYFPGDRGYPVSEPSISAEVTLTNIATGSSVKVAISMETDKYGDSKFWFDAGY